MSVPSCNSNAVRTGAQTSLAQKSAYTSPTLTKHGEVAELTGTGGSFSGKRTRRRRRRRC